VDVFRTKKRSQIMSQIGSKNTRPELIVRSYLHSRGLRFRLHVRSLPGCPDLVFVRRRIALFVHGCFWHGHKGCKRGALPKTRAAFWRAKIDKNAKRDLAALAALRKLGWRTLQVWSCQLQPAKLDKLYLRIAQTGPDRGPK
jgi:DNA mismatch endonuclease (patch repair protein)